MKTLFALLALTTSVALADDVPKQPRTRGNTAVMGVFYYSPKTMEITYVDTYLFKDAQACQDAITQAFAIAAPHAGSGDMVNVRCFTMNPPAAVKDKPKSGLTEL